MRFLGFQDGLVAKTLNTAFYGSEKFEMGINGVISGVGKFNGFFF